MGTLVLNLTDSKKELLEKEKGHVLVLGGPGSGKTTIALLKAQKIVLEDIKKHQNVLFLSFARATIARVEDRARELINPKVVKQIDINTYHGFAWNLVKNYGYLLNSKKRQKLLTPPEASVLFAELSDEEKEIQKSELFYNEGILHFDLFAEISARLITESNSLSKILSEAYPCIILDEFQDTNSSEWDFIKSLGRHSNLICLADIDQRIYEFRGADPARVGQFIEEFEPDEFDFGNENNRSSGTDIAKFGNDLLKNQTRVNSYKDVEVIRYNTFYTPHLVLKIEVLKCIKRLSNEDLNQWSLAILVPTKDLMMSVSSFLSLEQNITGKRYPIINHEVQLEMAGPSLSAIMIARLLSKEGIFDLLNTKFLIDLYNHIRGRRGNKAPNKTDLSLTSNLKKYINTGNVPSKGKKALSDIVNEAQKICKICETIKFDGEPARDWIKIRELLLSSSNKYIKQVGEDAKYLRLLRKGAILNSGLANLWRLKSNYEGATELITNALLQEHFSASTRHVSGVHVMTIHAAKGKEFDEVIIYEDSNPYKNNFVNNFNIKQSVLALRVAVTRAMKRTTILTPDKTPCPII